MKDLIERLRNRGIGDEHNDKLLLEAADALETAKADLAALDKDYGRLLAERDALETRHAGITVEKLHRYTITGEGATKGYFRLVEDPNGAWVQWAEVEQLADLGGRELWGVFICSRELPNYDLQGAFSTEERALTVARELQALQVHASENPSRWVALSTGHHWVHPQGLVMRVSSFVVDVMRTTARDSDPPGLGDEIRAVIR